MYLDESERGWQSGPTSFVVNLPLVDLQYTNELIEIVFQTEVFRFDVDADEGSNTALGQYARAIDSRTCSLSRPAPSVSASRLSRTAYTPGGARCPESSVPSQAIR